MHIKFAHLCRDDLFTSMLPKYQDILRHEADLDILIFSGDVDGIVPVIGTRRWLASLQLPILKEWRPWYSHTGKPTAATQNKNKERSETTRLGCAILLYRWVADMACTHAPQRLLLTRINYSLGYEQVAPGFC